jgi:hypothetical protein
MWKIIDKNVVSQGFSQGQFISATEAPVEFFEIREVKENGNISAVSTLFRDYKIIFPEQDLLDARWWIMD